MFAAAVPRGDVLHAIAAVLLKLAWLALHFFFTVRSVGRAAVEQIFHLLGLAFLEPRRGLLYALRKLQRLMVRDAASISSRVITSTLSSALH